MSDATAITNILASAGLLHDIWNPPFGHFGEDTIRDWFSKNMNRIEMKNENGNLKRNRKFIAAILHSNVTNF